MSRRVVDELVVKFTVDMDEFHAGIAKAATERQKLVDDLKDSEEEQSKSFSNVVGRYIKWAAIFAAIGKTYKETLSVANELWDLSNASHRLGMSAGGLRTWQNAFEMLGGKAADATGEIEKFNDSLNAMTFKGDVGENIQRLALLGVRVRRGMSYEDTAPEVFTAIKRRQSQGVIKDVREAVWSANQVGFSGVGQFIAQNPNATIGEFNKFMADARSRAPAVVRDKNGKIIENPVGEGVGLGKFVTSQSQRVQKEEEQVLGQPGAANVAKEIIAGVKGAKILAADLVSIAAKTVNVIVEKGFKTGFNASSVDANGVKSVALDSGDILYYDKNDKFLPNYVPPTPALSPPTPRMQRSGVSGAANVNQTLNFNGPVGDPNAVKRAAAQGARQGIAAQADGSGH